MSTVAHTLFSVLNISIMIPVLQILFEESTIVVSQKPDWEVSLQYLKELFYFHFGTVVQDQGKTSALYFVTTILVVSFLLSNVFGILLAVLTAKVRIRVISKLREEAFEKVSRFDLSYFTVQKKGDLVARITTDIQQVESTVVGALKALIKEPILIAGYFIVLFRLSPELTLYSLAIIPLSGGTISYLTKRLRRRARLTQAALSQITSTLDEAITGMRIIKAFDARRYVADKFNLEVLKYARHNFRMSLRQSFARPVSEFFGVMIMAVILLIGGTIVLSSDGNLTGSMFLGFLIVFSQILNPAKSFSTAISNIQRGLVSAERVFDLIDSEPRIYNRPGAKVITSITQGLRFEDVSFAYEDKAVLKRVSFEIKKGEIVALVGPSGGGKSTIADLIPRFYDPVSGSIELDGTDLRQLDLNALRTLMGIVTQESILFHDTIFKNIAFGKPEASLEEVVEAAKVANALEFIESLPSGFDTMIGERGTKLSGGQRQRLSIARAVLKNPPLLILDEATSALDSQSETLVQEAIFKLMANRTSLVIAHRLSTIKQADQILVVQEGSLVEQGNHDSLIKHGGLYQNLIEMQSFD